MKQQWIEIPEGIQSFLRIIRTGYRDNGASYKRHFFSLDLRQFPVNRIMVSIAFMAESQSQQPQLIHRTNRLIEPEQFKIIKTFGFKTFTQFLQRINLRIFNRNL